jgi:hypothetical protein
MNSEAIISTEIKPQLMEAFDRQTADVVGTNPVIPYRGKDDALLDSDDHISAGGL